MGERMSVQTVEQRVGELLRLRDKIDAELARIDDDYRPKKKRPRSVIPKCGTESAYQRHRWYGEDQDEACKAAHAAHERGAAMLRRMRKVAA